MTYTGPWLDDAIPAEQGIAGGDTAFPGDPAITWGWTSYSTSGDTSRFAKMDEAWNGIGDSITGPGTGFQGGSIDEGTDTSPGQAFWGVTWLTVTRPAAADVPLITAATLPSNPFSDPNVIGIEWEPTNTPVSQRLQVTTRDLVASFIGFPFDVKLVDGLGGRYEPSFETGSAMSGRDTVAQIAPHLSGGLATGSVSLDLPVDASGGLAVSLLDYWTAHQEIDDLPAGGSHTYRFSAALFYSFRPRYRLIYAVQPGAATPALRQVQRGDGYGIGGVPRAVSSRTRQASLRSGPGAIL